MAGKATVEMVAAVATDDPEIAAKILQETMVAIASPPGKFPTQL
jgi:hypothetical protein